MQRLDRGRGRVRERLREFMYQAGGKVTFLLFSVLHIAMPSGEGIHLIISQQQ